MANHAWTGAVGAQTFTYNPSAVQVATTQNYVSSLSIHKPQNAEEFVKRYGSQNLTGLVALFGGMEPVQGEQFRHWEEDYIHNAVSLESVANSVDGNSTAAVTNGSYLIAAAASENQTGTGAESYLRVGDYVLNNLGELGVVLSANIQDVADTSATQLEPGAGYYAVGSAGKNTYVVQGNSGSWTTTATSCIVIGSMWPEQSGQPKGLTPTPIEYTNKVQIMKDSFTVSGSEATNVSWIKTDGGYLWYLKGEADTYRRFQNHKEMTMLLGQSMTSQATGVSASATAGLLDFMGHSQTYTYGNGYTTTDLDQLVETLDNNRGAKNNALMCGFKLALRIDDLLASYNGYYSDPTPVGNYGEFGNSDDMMLKLGFKGFTRGGYTFHKSVYDPYGYAGMLGADGFDYQKNGFIMPLEGGLDAKTRESMPALKIRYKAAGGYSRETEHWLTGSAVLSQPTNETDELRCHYRSECGFEGFGPNRFVKITAA